MIYLIIFAASLVASAIMARLVRDVANARGWTTAPTSSRHLHLKPVPRLGGIAIMGSVVLVVSGAAIASSVFHLNYSFPSSTFLGLLGPTLVIFGLGLADDFRPLSPYLKFGVQILAAVWLFLNGCRVTHLPLLFGDRQMGDVAALGLTIFWVLLITNAFNLLDGLDGLAAGSALFSSLVVFVVSLVTGNTLAEVVTIALAGAIVGFLRYNFNPATIFLGDSGSLFIGFLLSALALEGAQKAPTIVAVAIPVVSFGLPILETSLSILRRLISGRPVFTADREHIHHKLLQHGLTHRQVVIVLYGVSAIFALLSLFLLWPTGSSLGLVLAVLGTGIWIGVQRLGYLELGELARVAQRTFDQRQIVINNLAIRRATEELKVVDNYEQVWRVLQAAFNSNDFYGFDVRFKLFPGEFQPAGSGGSGAQARRGEVTFHWGRSVGPQSLEGLALWTLSLDLVSSSNRHRGALVVRRLYSQRNLQMDINLLTSNFPIALADALDRTLQRGVDVIHHAGADDHGFVAAQAG